VAQPGALLPGAVLLAALLGVVVGQAEAATSRVQNLNDSGPGSLRQAILNANATLGADVSRFAEGLQPGSCVLSRRGCSQGVDRPMATAAPPSWPSSLT
jgi:hypothetical protein